ncbi:MAG: hypothetical protein ACQEXE_05180 [Bacillota bacterium]|uniref:hypothetical protein n=1 Tax=Bacillaceae TaxID=186817 RepID=UPI0021BD2DF0|nr:MULTISPECIES: hypothetical protein [Bacillaceae]
MDRGLIQEGYWADIAIFDPNTIEIRLHTKTLQTARWSSSRFSVRRNNAKR